MKSSVTENAIGRCLKNKTILVTGGTGSFGRTIVREILQYHPACIRIYSRSEDKQERMRLEFEDNPVLHFILGDVRDPDQLFRSMKGVDIVFHAAAQKQVPCSETQVLEAVKTNILGAQNVIDAATAHDVGKVIAISTDKAVEPVNTMGMSKALQEKLFTAANGLSQNSSTAFYCVRYGNVLGSTGSVLPLFLRQIRRNDYLTVTDISMTRFILTLYDATRLVCTALVNGTGGDIFVPDIPSHFIFDLARAVLHVHNLDDKRIRFTGIRPGEKIHEKLITVPESLRARKHAGYYVIKPFNERHGDQTASSSTYELTSENARKLDVGMLEEYVSGFIDESSDRPAPVAMKRPDGRSSSPINR